MVRKDRLPNGLQLITESMPHVRSVAIGVWLKQGSRHEPAPLNGISHFIEHLLFKGTETRSAREIARVMDSVGGQMDAFTSKEYTCFYAKVLDDHLPVAVDLLADIVRHPRFDPEDVERERQVVMEEIRMVEDTPEELVYDLFASHFFGRHPLGRPIQGTHHTVAALNRPRLLHFFRTSYRPANMLIAAAGRVRHDEILRLVTKAFGAIAKGGGTRSVAAAPRPRSGWAHRPKKELEQLHLVIGLPGFPESFGERYVLHVLNALLGGTVSSRLFQKIREERGLAYSVYSAVNGFKDTGALLVYAATRPSQGREVVRLTLDELRDLREKGPEKSEVEVARQHLRGSLVLSLESTVSRMSNLARQELYFRRQYSPEDILRRLDAVTHQQLHRLAARLFVMPRLTLAAVGRSGRLASALRGA